jgi:RHS repeat-associated protein
VRSVTEDAFLRFYVCRYTGKERDTESGLDYFGARYYGSNMGRFMSPDDGSDWDPSDPQSWNLYSYVRNNPLKYTDPTGHDCVYLNATGTGAEEVDNQSSKTECMGDGTDKNKGTGGYWVDGKANTLYYDPNSNAVALTGTVTQQGQPQLLVTSAIYNSNVSSSVTVIANDSQFQYQDLSSFNFFPKDAHFQFQTEQSFSPWQMLKRMVNCWATDDPSRKIAPKLPEPKASTDTIPNGAASLNMQHQMDKHGSTTGRPTGNSQATEAAGTAGDAAGMFNDVANCAGGH